MHRKHSPDVSFVAHLIGQFPHCDQRILHAPGECQYCDKHPEWQALRLAWGIAFTGYQPDGKELPCPAMHARPEAFQAWSGNRPVSNASSTERLPEIFTTPRCTIAHEKTNGAYTCTREAGHDGPCAAAPNGIPCE